MVPPRARRRRSGRNDPDQFSFFDPLGELPEMRRDLQELQARSVTQAEHRTFLEEGLARALASVASAKVQLQRSEADSARAEAAADGGFEATIWSDGQAMSFSERRAAGEALLVQLGVRRQALERLTPVGGLGRIGGLDIWAVVVAKRDGDELVLAPAFGDPDTAYYMPAEIEADFSLTDDAETVIERYESALSGVAVAAVSWRASLARAEAEARDFRQQIDALVDIDVKGLEELRAKIDSMESGTGGLFASGTDANERSGHATDTATEEPPAERLRGQAQGVSGPEPSGDLRLDGEERGTGALPSDGGRAGGERLRIDGRPDDRDGQADRGSGGPGAIPEHDSADGRGDHRRGLRVRAAVVDEAAARRRERAALNFRILPEHAIGAGTPKQKVAANIAAIRILKTLTDEARPASDEERAALVKYVGWGAFAQAIFDKDPRSANARSWERERQQLADLLTTQEWDAARASTLNAHYTSESVIRGVWSAIEHLGFTGGRAIEPALGAGHFVGLTPDRLRDEIAWTGVEIDPLTSDIAQVLYPGADIRSAGFQTVNWPDGFFDLAISNVPFGSYSVRDISYRRPMSIHDYFFVKSLDKVRPGGLVAFITTHYTLDKVNELARSEIAKRGAFLGAIRLPGGDNGAFAKNAGTEVTTDIIFLRKRHPGEEPGDRSWMDLAEIQTPEGPASINAYFARNPHMMLGEMRLLGTMRSANNPVLIGDSERLDARIAEASVAGLPANAFAATRLSRHAVPAAAAAQDQKAADSTLKEGAFYRRDGLTYRVQFGVGVEQKVSRTEATRLASLIEIRDLVNDLLDRQARGDKQDRGELRASLNRAYDGFVRRYGPINKTVITTTSRLRGDGTPVIIQRFPNFAAFRDDPDAFKVAAIENYDPASDTASKAAIFSHDIIQPDAEPVVTGPGDALAVSLNQRGRVDIELIARHLGVTTDEAIARLDDQIWLDPAGDVWRTSEDYLSGDVVQRLEDALVAAETDERYRRNVEALEEVQPVPLTRIDINVLFGAPWVPIDIYRAFLEEVVTLPAETLTYSDVTKKWQFRGRTAVSESAAAQFSSPRSSVTDIVTAALNNAEIRIFNQNSDGTPILDAEASGESNAKVAEVRALFSGSAEDPGGGWLWQDDDRAARLEMIYNNRFNRLVPTAYDGSHQTLPGIVRYVRTTKGDIIPFELRPHQKNAVWRLACSGNTLLDHAVGAGKTFTMIAGGMEQKRLGLIRRPMFVVPNHMLEQFSREFLQAYPTAKLLVADKASMSKDRRREFAARAATDNWDGIIITHDAFGRIRMSDEAYTAFLRAEKAEVEAFQVRARDEEGKDSATVKELERAKIRLEVRLGKLVNQERKDEGVTFEELGVDFLFVDEAHAFKNLAFRTRHARVKGLAQAESQRATDLLLKIRHLDESRPGRSVAFATGTPISNTIAEMFTMQRYLQKETLEQYGIDEFDAWAATFAEIVTQLELAPNGRDFRSVRSFSRFVNIPELIGLYSRVADTQTADMLALPRPKLRDGIQLVKTEMSGVETAIMGSLVARAEAIKGKRPEKGADNMLKILGEGLKLATDIRLLNPDAPFNPTGKVAAAVENIHRIWRDGKDPGLSQIVFLDMGVPGSKPPARKPAAFDRDDDGSDDVVVLDGDDGEDEIDNEPLAASRFNLYEDIRQRLVDKGVPREQIAFIHDATTDEKKGRLFADVRQGRVRVLIGSTGKMGVGTNVQERLVAMHHLDAPWRPADVEQRDGRILRQGNRNPEIEILRYITERSLDAFRWQILTTKANFIAQIRAGAKGLRTAGDIDSPLPEAAAIKAAATGDPRIMEHAELTKEIRILEAARRSYERTIAAARNGLARTMEKIHDLHWRIEKASSDAAKVVDLSGDGFSVAFNLDGHKAKFADRKPAGEILVRYLLRAGNQHWDTTATMLTLGDISGFEMRAFLRRKEGALLLDVQLGGALSYGRGEWFALTETTDALGLIRRFEGLLRSIPHYADRLQGDLAKAEAELPRLERQLNAPPFAKQDLLDAGAARIKQLEAELQPKSPDGANAMPRDPQNAEWDDLPEEVRQVVREVIAEAIGARGRVSIEIGMGDVYAFPRNDGGIAWGANGGDHGFLMARGIIAGRELKDELAQRERANAEVKAFVAAGIASREGVDEIRQLNGSAPARQLSGPALDADDRALHALGRRLADNIGAMPSREQVIADALEAGLMVRNGVDAARTARQDLTPIMARLEPHEFEHLHALQRAGTDEDAFHLAFTRLRTDEDADAEAVSKIAGAYTGKEPAAGGREGGLGAIETRFYEQRNQQARANGQDNSSRSALH